MLTLKQKQVVAWYLLKRRKEKQRRQYRIHPMLENRDDVGAFKILFEDLRKDPRKFFSYFRMSMASFDELHDCLKGVLQRQNTVMRNCIQPIEMLAVAIRYLATGNTLSDTHFSYKLGISTASKIVYDVCTAIWDILGPKCFPKLTADKLKEISKGFQEKANFPHCIGAVDGKHIRIVKPGLSGSMYFNYKSYFSVVIVAVCDADYRFTYVDIGAYGSESDSAIFEKSTLWSKIQNKDIALPESEPLPGSLSPKVPYFLVGDEAFALNANLMRPFGGTNLPVQDRVFNYRLCRARRYIECTFGIMSNKWRILHRAIDVRIELAVKLVQACVVLHNFVRERDGYRVEDTTGATSLESIGRQGDSVQSEVATPTDQIRHVLAQYFMTSVGSVPWQWDSI